MNSKKIETIKRFFSKTATEKDMRNLFLWFNSEKGNHEINQTLDENWSLTVDTDDVQVDSVKILSNIRKTIKSRQTISLSNNIKWLLPYAAILVLAFVLGGVIFSMLNFNNYSDNTNLALTSVVVENGQRSKVILPDSTVVWINSGTTLNYNSDFAQGEREIYLNGQAFFEVTRNEKMPLRVHCNDFIVRVLGTRFDVNAYPNNQSVSVALESGSVQLDHDVVKNFSYRLKPGELANFDTQTNKVVIGSTDIGKLTSWKDGVLVFKNDPMREVIEKLERWYNIKIEVSDPAVYQSIFTATIRNESFEQILGLMEFTCPVKYNITNKNLPGSIPQIIISMKN